MMMPLPTTDDDNAADDDDAAAVVDDAEHVICQLLLADSSMTFTTPSYLFSCDHNCWLLLFGIFRCDLWTQLIIEHGDYICQFYE